MKIFGQSGLDQQLKMLEAFSNEAPRFLYLLLNNQGKIERIFHNPATAFQELISEIEETKDVRNFYPFQVEAGSPETGAWTDWRAAKNFRYFSETFGFYTSLPLSALRATRLNDRLLAGRISFNDIIPNTATRITVGTIYVDSESDRLVGFNDAFYNDFRNAFPSHDALLNTPMAELLSPSPGEIQSQHRPAADREPSPARAWVYERQFRIGEPPGPEQFFGRPATRFLPDGMLWDNDTRRTAYLMPLTPLNTEKDDFTVTIAYRSLQNGSPVVFAGDPCRGETPLPDEEGYLAGVDYLKSRWLIKRCGHVATHGPWTDLSEGAHRLTLIKEGKRLLLFHDGKLAVACFDPDFIGKPHCFISLGLRPGDKILLESIRIGVSAQIKGSADQHEEKLVLAPRARGEKRYFRLERFYNVGLAAQTMFLPVFGYYLYDVTDMKAREVRLNHEIKNEKDRSGRLGKDLLRVQPFLEEGKLIGKSEAIAGLRAWADKMAQAGATILVEGETGTGKEVFARYMHQRSDRQGGPFVKVDCAAIPASLLESQLFGHEKGAFTGAEARHIGYCERAHCGTLFLDEIENLSLETQAKLLQFLNDFSFTRLGGQSLIKIDVHCIAASNKRLVELIQAGRFREDLYYRLNVLQIRMPALRERQEDIPELCTHFFRYFNLVHGKKIEGLAPEAMSMLRTHAWPGNIRELRNVMERAVLLCAARTIAADLLQFDTVISAKRTGKRGPYSARKLTLTPPETVRALLKRHHGKVSAAVKELGATGGAFYRYLKLNKIDPDDFRRGFEAA